MIIIFVCNLATIYNEAITVSLIDQAKKAMVVSKINVFSTKSTQYKNKTRKKPNGTLFASYKSSWCGNRPFAHAHSSSVIARQVSGRGHTAHS
ncbi:MAG: hypothetical protein MJE68_23025 [Proteobacteria bacterium]|nr:hypothetical protein [Pseudomonadota bacterium]